MGQNAVDELSAATGGGTHPDRRQRLRGTDLARRVEALLGLDPAASGEGAGHAAPLGLHLLFGPVIGVMFQNLARNLEEHRIAVIEAVFARA